jgi:predicted methyltransferase MtxX (methanogen marker protein 4)
MTVIGLGLGKDVEKVRKSIENASKSSEIICYCREECLSGTDDSIVFRTSDHPHQSLVDDLVSGRINAAVRGSLPANETLSALKAATGVDHLERAALLETADGKKFFLAPVGIDEGWSVAEKVILAKKYRRWLPGSGYPKRLQSYPAAGSATWEDIPLSTGRWRTQNLLPALQEPGITRS